MDTVSLIGWGRKHSFTELEDTRGDWEMSSFGACGDGGRASRSGISTSRTRSLRGCGRILSDWKAGAGGGVWPGRTTSWEAAGSQCNRLAVLRVV